MVTITVLFFWQFQIVPYTKSIFKISVEGALNLWEVTSLDLESKANGKIASVAIPSMSPIAKASSCLCGCFVEDLLA